jgi:hypothetical protein
MMPDLIPCSCAVTLLLHENAYRFLESSVGGQLFVANVSIFE